MSQQIFFHCEKCKSITVGVLCYQSDLLLIAVKCKVCGEDCIVHRHGWHVDTKKLSWNNIEESTIESEDMGKIVR